MYSDHVRRSPGVQRWIDKGNKGGSEKESREEDNETCKMPISPRAASLDRRLLHFPIFQPLDVIFKMPFLFCNGGGVRYCK